MAEQGRWILKNIKHNRPGVTIQGASLACQRKTVSIGDITSTRKEDITTEWFTDLGVNLPNFKENKEPGTEFNPEDGYSPENGIPDEGQEIIIDGIKYKVHWKLSQVTQPEPEPEPEITYGLEIVPAQKTISHQEEARFDAILYTKKGDVRVPSMDRIVTSNTTWKVPQGEQFVIVNEPGASKFIVTGNNTSDQTQDVTIKAEFEAPDGRPLSDTASVKVKKQGEINLSQDEISFECQPGTTVYTIRVTVPAGVQWTADTADDVDWITVYDINTSTDEFKVKVSDNDTDDDRTGLVVVRPVTEGQATPAELSVVQTKCPEPETRPTIVIVLDDTNVLKLSGGIVNATVTVTDGFFVNLEMDPATGIKYQVMSTKQNGNIQTVKLRLSVDSTNQPRTFEITANGKDEYEQTCEDSVTLQQVKSDWVLSDVDYIIFTYEWDSQNGKDLDSLTFMDGVPDAPYMNNAGVGWYNGRTHESGSRENWLGPTADYDSAILKFAGDNTQTGGEYTLVNLKKLNEHIKNKQLSDDATVIVYLMGNWYGEKGDGYATIAFSAYTGGEVTRKDLGDNKFMYEVSDDSEFRDSKKQANINVFASSHRHAALKNASSAITCYSTMAALVYDLKSGVFYLVTGDDLKNDPKFSSRYQYGLESYYTGQWTVTDGNGNVYKVAQGTSYTSVYPKVNLEGQREYTAVTDVAFVAITGDSQSVYNKTPITLNNCEETTHYSGAEFQQIDNKSFKVKFTEPGTFYGSYYRIKYTYPDGDKYMTLLNSQGNSHNFDIEEAQE